MKKIETLVEDINDFVNGVNLIEYAEDHLNDFSKEFGELYASRLLSRDRRDNNVGQDLRMSAMGTSCVRKLWYKKHNPNFGEGLDPSARLKFLFGDFLEVLLLQLARDSGHKVEGEQEEMVLHGVKGHRDAVIDGVTIDCKSASSFSFRKFKEGLNPESDSFGYLTQLASYVYAGKDDPLVIDKTRGAFLVIDKQHGHIHLDIHEFPYLELLDDHYDFVKSVVNNGGVLPDRAFTDVADGKSGNRKLSTVCSYCEFKHNCWDNLRTFIYSNGPRYLTKTIKEPNVYEEKS